MTSSPSRCGLCALEIPFPQRPRHQDSVRELQRGGLLVHGGPTPAPQAPRSQPQGTQSEVLTAQCQLPAGSLPKTVLGVRALPGSRLHPLCRGSLHPVTGQWGHRTQP